MQLRTTSRPLFTALTAVMVVATSMVTSTAGAEGGVQDVDLSDYIQIKTQQTSAVLRGDTVWVTVSIRGRDDIDDVRFTGRIDGMEVEYPSNTVDHSGPYNDYQIDDKETDYVAFKVTMPEGLAGNKADLDLEASFTVDGDLLHGTGTVRIPAVDFTGSPYALLSDEVTVSAAANGWVEVSFAGLAPRLEDFEVKIVDPSALDVLYPLDTYTSLAGDSLLEDGETDVVRFRLGESLWGTPLDVELEVRYTLDSVSETALHDLAIVPA